MLEIISFIGLVILFFFITIFLIFFVKSIIWNIEDIFGPVVNDIKASVKKKNKDNYGREEDL